MISEDVSYTRATNYPKDKSKHRKKNKSFIFGKELPSVIYQRFLANICKRRLKFLNQRVNDYYGKNFPVNYKQHYQFEEEWSKRINVEEKSNEKLINEESIMDIIHSVLTIIIYSLTIWLSNIDFFFRGDGKIIFYYQTYTASLVVLLFNLILRISRLDTQKQLQLIVKSIMQRQYKSILLLIYFIIKIFGVNEFENLAWLLFEVSMLLCLYLQASNRYNCIRIMNFSLQYEYQTKVLDMIITIFIIAHIISIILYSSTKLVPETNWFTSLPINQSNEFIVYIYAFYFGTTTIMTIGYGDITPKNPIEVAIVIFVQIFGVIMLAYIINQIGYCITSLRKDQQTIEKDLSILQKLKKHYSMNSNLINKARSYIINNKPKATQLSPEEQNGILMKLNEEIRAGSTPSYSDIIKQNLISIVKSSIFFLCRWSSHFQISISNKLIHAMFNPNDILYQPEGKQRIYIIRSGKIQIFAGHMTGKKRTNDVLKTISNTIDKQVSDNCYGYSSVVSTRPVKLYAVSKNFTSSYFIEKEKFLQSVFERINDTQYYHQLKSQIDQAPSSESIEVSSVHSIRHHYNPSKAVVIRKYCKRSSQHQDRQYILRNDRDLFRSSKPVFDQEMKRRIRQTFIGSIASFDTICMAQTTDPEEQKKTIQEDNLELKEAEQFSCVNEENIKFYFDHFFQSSKDYINYFCKRNKQEILKRYEKNVFYSLNISNIKRSRHLHHETNHFSIERFQ